jgi:hypothetical protein
VLSPGALEVVSESGESLQSRELGSVILAATSMRLTPKGLDLFVVAPNFFFSKKSIVQDLSRLGLGLEAAFAFPAGCFAPYMGI